MDFSKLNDEQLLDLLKACMSEATRRGLAMQRAASEAVLDAQEVARIKAEALEREREKREKRERERIEAQAEQEAKNATIQTEAQKTAESWQKRKAIGVALDRWGVTEDWQINVWSRGADVRVYVEGGGGRTYAWKMCLYVTGNSYHPPGELEVEKANLISPNSPLADKANRQLFKQFLLAINDRWNSLKLTNTEVENFSGEPTPKHLKVYLDALGVTANV